MPSPNAPPEDPAEQAAALPERRVHLVLLGPHTRVVATLCVACPTGPAGCCAAPPGLSWADIGRIAALGGAAWVVAEMRAGRLRRGPRGLIIERVDPAGDGAKKCVYHADGSGCFVPPDRRSAACNYYVCGDALEEGGGEVVAAEAACRAWTAQYATWDEILSAEVRGWGGTAETDEAEEGLFTRLGERFRELSGWRAAASGEKLRP